jgi:hypothetical protein
MPDIRAISHTFKLHESDLGRFAFDDLIFGDSIAEERARTVERALTDIGVRTHRCTLIDDALVSFDSWPDQFNLYEATTLATLVSRMGPRVAIDLTSLEHRVWAPLVRTVLERGLSLLALYTEPADYRKHDDQPGAIYDLSSTHGIEPLPGFARLARRVNDHGAFAPLLGFEGARLMHIFDQEEVDARLTSPVVGAPGFRLEYSTHSYIANRDTLDQERMEDRVELAAASCPFEAYDALDRIHERTGRQYLRVAPIGTKPHALGAVLYAIDHPEDVELVYVHPVRTDNRTEGTGSIYVYDVTSFKSDRDRTGR